MKKIEEVKILLMQMRKDKETLEDELVQFATHAGLTVEQVDTFRPFEEELDVTGIQRYDAFFVGGSSDDGMDLVDAAGDVSKLPEWLQKVATAIATAREFRVPSFLSCFGFQVAGSIFGGMLEYKPESEEFGTLAFRLTEAGKRDLLFKDVPDPFHAVVGHKKFLTKLPEGAVNLVETDVCPIHTFTFPGEPFYAFQFHPELTKKQLLEWLTRYKERYFTKSDGTFDEEAYQRSVTGHVEVSDANAIIQKFMERVVLTA